jgi:hypothetical protein
MGGQETGFLVFCSGNKLIKNLCRVQMSARYVYVSE